MTPRAFTRLRLHSSRYAYAFAAGVTPQVSLSGAQSQTEGNSGPKTFTYTVSRTVTTGAVSVPWTFEAGGTSASDFSGGAYPTGGTVELSSGQASGTFTVTISGDASVEGNETFTVSITAPSGYSVGVSSATGTILNDDAASFPAEARPSGFTITYAGNAFGDSTFFGVGAPTGQDIVARMRAGVSSGPTAQAFHLLGTSSLITANYFGNGGQSGQNTATIASAVAYAKTNYASEMNRMQFFSGGLNDYNTGVTGWSRDWPAQVKTNFATMAAASNTAADFFFKLAPLESNTPPGSPWAADHAFHRRDMRATYGRRAVDPARWLRFRRELESPSSGNADAKALGLGLIPYSARGYPTASGDFADGDPAITVQSAAPTIGSAGTDGAMIWATTPRQMYRCGAGGWQVLDIKHQGRVGNTRLALMLRDMQAASEGSGPPFVVPMEARIAADAGSGSLVCQLPYTGTATAFALADMSGTQSTLFNVNATGEVSRSATGSLAEGLTTLIVAATNANGTLYSPLDIFVGRASTATAPQMRTISSGINAIDAAASGGCVISGRWANGMADSAAMSFAFWINPAALSGFLAVLAGSPRSPLQFSILGSGGVRATVVNSAGTQVIGNSTGATLTAAQNRWVFGKVNASAFQFYFNDTNASPATAPPGGTFELASTATNARPIFLASTYPNQAYEAPTPFIGGIGFIGFWDADIDWSVQATRRQLMNADGTPVAGRAPYSAVGGAAPKIEMWGGLGDWLWGTPDGSHGPQTMSLDHRAIARMT